MADADFQVRQGSYAKLSGKRNARAHSPLAAAW
jgi:hypothetical protein